MARQEDKPILGVRLSLWGDAASGDKVGVQVCMPITRRFQHVVRSCAIVCDRLRSRSISSDLVRPRPEKGGQGHQKAFFTQKEKLLRTTGKSAGVSYLKQLLLTLMRNRKQCAL